MFLHRNVDVNEISWRFERISLESHDYGCRALVCVRQSKKRRLGFPPETDLTLLNVAIVSDQVGRVI